MEARKMKASVAAILLTMEDLSSELARERVNLNSRECKRSRP
jgi:hypothetical protein